MSCSNGNVAAATEKCVHPRYAGAATYLLSLNKQKKKTVGMQNGRCNFAQLHHSLLLGHCACKASIMFMSPRSHFTAFTTVKLRHNMAISKSEERM